MKVISIKEPFATLIMNGSKLIETRSWKTNYRGELYIHASKKLIKKEYLNNPYIFKLVKDKNMNYGNIICKVNLVDCIYMDQKFLDEIKKNKQEYNLGLYKLGRYAWLFKDVVPINPVEAKGKLNIWNYEEDK